MEKILVGYDGGERGRCALLLAGRLGRTFGARVDVVSVVPEGFGTGGRADVEPAIVHARMLVEARDLLRAEGIDAGLIEPAGDPAATIARLAGEGGYDTLIVGADGPPDGEGHGVAAHLAAHAATTVIVAR